MIEQQLLPTFEPSDEDMYLKAIRQPLEVKIRKAIKLYQTFEIEAKELSKKGYYLAFSGGKDSIVIKELAIMAKVGFESWYNNVTIDPPELVQFIKKHHSEVQWNNTGKHLCKRMVEKRTPPTRLIRWCCQEYKEGGGNGQFKIIGVRSEESARRKGMWKQVVKNKKSGMILCPILYWTDEDIWNFIKQRNMPYCKLYDEGFKRLGCIGCPMGGSVSQKMEFSRYPRYRKLWFNGFKDLWENHRHEITRRGTPRFFNKFKSPEEFFDWWISGQADKPSDECQGMFMFSNLDEDDEVDNDLQ